MSQEFSAFAEEPTMPRFLDILLGAPTYHAIMLVIGLAVWWKVRKL